MSETVEKNVSVLKDKNNDEAYPPFNFSWLGDKKIAGMGWPQNVPNLNYCAKVGINHLITLSPERVPPILQCTKKLKWTEISVKEFSAPTLKQILKFINICQRAEIRGEVVGVHCRQGRGRTGVMLACYLVCFQGLAPERAVLTVRILRPGSCETYEQEKAVCHYHDCLRGTISQINYRLVDNKQYFDENLREEFDDFKPKNPIKDEKESTESEEKKPIREKSKAMVINHKIYF